MHSSPSTVSYSSERSSPLSLPVYAEALAIAYAEESSTSSGQSHRRGRRYDPRVIEFIDLTAMESDDECSD